MIHVVRKRVAPPSALKSPKLLAELAEAEHFYSHPVEERAQKHFMFRTPPGRVQGLKEALINLFNRKCCYCENYLATEFLDVENFRPKGNAVGLDGSISPDHYWWLTYEWENLYLSCADCNRTKAGRFPVRGERASFTDGERGLAAEWALLLDPCAGDPELLLVFDESGLVASDDERARVTIEVVGLNRRTLVESRRQVYKNLEADFKRLLDIYKMEPWGALFSKELKRVVGYVNNPKTPFLALHRQLLQQLSATAVQKNAELEKTFELFLNFRTALTEKAAGASPRALHSAAAKTVQDFKREQKKRDSYSAESEEHKEDFFLTQRLVERIQVSNFRNIRALTLDFPPPPPRQKAAGLLLLGENATGKTSVLQAVALALMGEAERKLLQPDARELVRKGAKGGFVKIHLTNTTKPLELHFDLSSEEFTMKPKELAGIKILHTAYGATRLLPQGQPTPAPPPPDTKASKPHNLFNPFVPLVDAPAWLCDLEARLRKAAEERNEPPESYKQAFGLVVNDLKRLLMLDNDSQFECRDGKVMVDFFGEKKEIRQLSEGYKAVVALAVDIVSVMHFRWQSMEAAEGLVLVDEIDSHLHPAWKMRIVKRLREVFPRLQFLATSHDPLTLRGLHQGEVVVMRRDSRNVPYALTDLPAPDAMRVEQILTSEFFGLNSTSDPDVDDLFNEYYDLLALKKPGEEQRARLEELSERVKGLEVLGETPRENILLEAADEFLAKQSVTADPDERRKLKESTRRKIAEIWKGSRRSA